MTFSATFVLYFKNDIEHSVLCLLFVFVTVVFLLLNLLVHVLCPILLTAIRKMNFKILHALKQFSGCHLPPSHVTWHNVILFNCPSPPSGQACYGWFLAWSPGSTSLLLMLWCSCNYPLCFNLFLLHVFVMDQPPFNLNLCFLIVCNIILIYLTVKIEPLIFILNKKKAHCRALSKGKTPSVSCYETVSVTTLGMNILR